VLAIALSLSGKFAFCKKRYRSTKNHVRGSQFSYFWSKRTIFNDNTNVAFID
jgi:hypothetical protein